MKDRVSGAGGYNTVNGAKRYAVYGSASATTPTEYLFLLIDDNPTETGTALNKANLLSDATATKFSLTSDGTVNDALDKVGAYTDLALSSGWSQGTLSSQTVYYKDVSVTGVTTASKPMLHAILPQSSVVSKSDVKTARKQASKVIGFDVVENGSIRLYAYENITTALVARFTNI